MNGSTETVLIVEKNTSLIRLQVYIYLCTSALVWIWAIYHCICYWILNLICKCSYLILMRVQLQESWTINLLLPPPQALLKHKFTTISSIVRCFISWWSRWSWCINHSDTTPELELYLHGRSAPWLHVDIMNPPILLRTDSKNPWHKNVQLLYFQLNRFYLCYH